MALKGDRVVLETDVTMTCESTSARGVVLCHATSGSGVAIGDSAGKADLFADPSGKRVSGLLMNDVVNVDQTRYHKNFHKDETMVSERCVQLRKGKVTTDKVTGTPTPGDPAYLTASGVMTPTRSATGGIAATPPVGEFKSLKDADGFATVELNLPFPPAWR